jgi:hypothetical protein
MSNDGYSYATRTSCPRDGVLIDGWSFHHRPIRYTCLVTPLLTPFRTSCTPVLTSLRASCTSLLTPLHPNGLGLSV